MKCWTTPSNDKPSRLDDALCKVQRPIKIVFNCIYLYEKNELFFVTLQFEKCQTRLK